MRRRSVRSDGEAKSGLRLTSIFLFHIVQKVSSARLDRCSDVRFGRRQKYKDHVGRACVEGVDAVHLLVQQREAHAPARWSSRASKTKLMRQQDGARAPARRSSRVSKTKLMRQQREARAPARRSSHASKMKLTRQQDEAHTPACRSSCASKMKLTRQLFLLMHQQNLLVRQLVEARSWTFSLFHQQNLLALQQCEAHV